MIKDHWSSCNDLCQGQEMLWGQWMRQSRSCLIPPGSPCEGALEKASSKQKGSLEPNGQRYPRHLTAAQRSRLLSSSRMEASWAHLSHLPAPKVTIHLLAAGNWVACFLKKLSKIPKPFQIFTMLVTTELLAMALSHPNLDKWQLCTLY